MKHPVRNFLLFFHIALAFREAIKTIDMKNFFSSKTVWFNLLTLLATGLAYLKPELLTAIGVPPVSQTQVLTIAGTFASIVNLLLRTFFTSQPIGTTAKALIFILTLSISANLSAQTDTTRPYAIPNLGWNLSVPINNYPIYKGYTIKANKDTTVIFRVDSINYFTITNPYKGIALGDTVIIKMKSPK